MASARQKAPPHYFVFDTHPIQYRSPVFASLQQKLPGLKVFFFNSHFDGKKWWFREFNKSPKQDFKVELREGYSSETLNTDQTGLLGFLRKSREIIRTGRPKGVVIYGWYLPEHWILWALCRFYSVPLIFVGETFSKKSTRFREAFKNILYPVFFRWVKQVISIGRKTTEFYQSLNIDGSRITRAKYCVDVSFFEIPSLSASGARQNIREEVGIEDNEFCMLFVGRLFDRKRPVDAIKLHEKLYRNTNLHTVIVGNGPLEKELYEHYRSVPRLSFVGFKNQRQVRAFYYAADLLIVPSLFETWGLVINEAAACGRPALVTDTCGAAGDLVQHDETGWIYPMGDLARAENILQSLLLNPGRVYRAGQVAQMSVKEEYSVPQFADAMVRAFQTAEGTS